MGQREGTNFVGTDWHTNQSQTFYFTATRVPNTRNVRVDWWMTTACNDSAASPTYYLCYGAQSLVVDGTTKVSWTTEDGDWWPKYRTSSGSVVWRGFTDTGSWLDRNYNKGEFFDTNGDYTGIRRWVQILGTKWVSGSFVKAGNADGSLTFTVVGKFGWYARTGLNFSKTFTIKNIVPVATYSVKYHKNSKSGFVAGNSVSNLPSNQTKTWNKTLQLSTKKLVSTDEQGNQNYVFMYWQTKQGTGFSRTGDIYNPGASYTKNAVLDLYARWDYAEKIITLDPNGGTLDSSIINPIVTKYMHNITLPSPSNVYKYGCTLTSWRGQGGDDFIVSDEHNVSNIFTILKTDTLKAQYRGNVYTVILKDKDGKVLRTLKETYGDALKNDYTYIVPGYKCLGWSTEKLAIRNPDDSALPVVPNVPYTDKEAYSGKIYIPHGNYTSSECYISENVIRKHMIGEDIVLYPVLEYSTSMYVYDNGEWKLAMPYVYDNGEWKQSLGNIYDNDTWKK